MEQCNTSDSLLTVLVNKKTKIAEDIYAFELIDPFNDELPVFTPGSHIDLHIRKGIIRQYSICSSPAERNRYVIGVLREEGSRGGSSAMHKDIQEGSFLTISRPRNNFKLIESAEKSLLIAGGIGITPILSMALQLAEQRQDFELHYCARSRRRAAFVEDIARFSLVGKVRLYYDDEPDISLSLEEVLARPTGNVHVYVCGPGRLIESVVKIAKEKAWPESNLHFERFKQDASIGSGVSDSPFEVKIYRTGKIYRIPPNTSVAKELKKHGYKITTSCEQGLCGACMTRVVEGIPMHRDQYLNEEEKLANNYFLPCCSRSETPLLVLDI
jgi:vanillate monooxygenase ferredoxin subunit